ncbi:MULTISPECIES: hypothetical protein [unclassified Chelatococcus]|jgi:hypothetical protein|uniref:hypothetical protein n=1 Tax=unclassified Chelatococcus TaxID=2638111 RepID=UPI001BCA81DC|nr:MULTISPECIES: hypothetical protein [unclassified Chelatococcus]CAH1655997.1 conserved exported hypothetical protein [Hyphomicrobiales bacterium]MBS7742522.1 hypothetical protein [Chelatococcus sp. HY11]MBX3542360.1 hypothetical protein [Chelatococcus sp.]MCO5075422.1 hypothetical protein [Chelatococcus sp.]CAH1695705.1 conserved exported hypothetical protein [Hyphomicrobiales bacterium]
MLHVRAIFPLLLVAFPALAQDTRAPRPQYAVACGAQFARSASHARLVKFYGAKNVTFESVNRPEGEVVKATVLFGKDPGRRLEIEWHDEKKRRSPSVMTVFGETNKWIGPLGIKNGMTIQEIEQRAGKPFKINGFGFDVAGAGHFEETKLEKLPGGCFFNAHFDIEGGLPPEHLERFVGDVAISSDDPDLLTLKPKLWIYTLTYPPPSTD